MLSTRLARVFDPRFKSVINISESAASIVSQTSSTMYRMNEGVDERKEKKIISTQSPYLLYGYGLMRNCAKINEQ